MNPIQKRYGRLKWQMLAVVVLASVSFGNAMAAAAAFYKGKTVHLVVGFKPGGGYDTYARLIAPALEKRIGATVVVDNQPGGGGLLALNRLVHQRADGTTLMLVSAESAALAQLTNRPGARFDLNKLSWLGRAVVDTRMVMWSAKEPERTFGQALKTMRDKGSRWGATGLTDSVSDNEAVMGQALDLNPDQLSIVLGYKGTSGIALAAVRGEVDGLVVSSTSAINYAGNDSLVPLAALSRERDKLFPNTPTIFETADLDKKGQWWIDFRSKITSLGRALVTQGDVPDNRTQYLARNLREILTNKDFIAKADAMNRTLDYQSGQKEKVLVNNIFDGLSDARKKRIKYVLTKKFIR